MECLWFGLSVEPSLGLSISPEKAKERQSSSHWSALKKHKAKTKSGVRVKRERRALETHWRPCFVIISKDS